MGVHTVATSHRRSRPSLLDVVAEVLVADPAASLAEVAKAAGIGRTTLHKNYATRDDLLRAVGQRAFDLWEQAIAGVGDSDDPDGGLEALVTAMIPIGPQLAFVWRTPAFDRLDELTERWQSVETQSLAVLKRAQHLGCVAAGTPDWWLLQMLYSVVYGAGESVRAGQLAPLDAPGLALGTFLYGLGASGHHVRGVRTQSGRTD